MKLVASYPPVNTIDQVAMQHETSCPNECSASTMPIAYIAGMDNENHALRSKREWALMIAFRHFADNEEEQEMEIEALQSILMNDIEGHIHGLTLN